MQVDIVERMFKSDDPMIRNAAIDFLRKLNTDYVGTLATLVDDKDKDIRKFVVDTLSDHSSKEAQSIVQSRLNDPAAVVRQAAIEVLGRMGAKTAIPDIEKRLFEETNLMIRCTCLETLAELGFSPSAPQIIQRISKEDNIMLVFSLLRYIGNLGTPEDLTVLESLFLNFGNTILKPLTRSAFNILQRYNTILLPPAILQAIKNALDVEPDNNVAWELGRALLFGMGKEGIETARTMLNERMNGKRMAAAEYMDQFGSDEDMKRVQEILR
ncbi:MAG: HEAT repeat domain-containing protein [Desulfobacterales bacterium]|nr:HEAT repeat domain-containing protein [Desulfobacterales bacterium]